MGEVRFCPNCGSPVESGYKFCPNCGSPLRVEEPRRPGGFTLQDVPRSPETRVGEKFTVFIEGVSRDLRFDGSGVQEFKKVPLEEALRLFSMLPRSYPEGFTPDEKTKLLIFNVGLNLSIGLRLDKAGSYDIFGYFSLPVYGGYGLRASFWIKDVDYDTACEAIRRYYTEPDFTENAFKAQERWVQEAEKGKYMAKIPCAVPIYHKGESLDLFLYGGLYAMRDGLALWPTSLRYYEPKRLPDEIQRMPFEPVKIKAGLIRFKVWMAEGLCHLPFHAVKKAKVKVKDAKMEMKYVDPRGKKRDMKFYFLIKEDVPKFCQAVTPYLADRLKIK